jgi:hypothetical protein
MALQHFRAFDGIVIGEGEEVHPAAFQQCVDLFGRAIAFAAKFSDEGGGTRSGEVGVNMQVAFHEWECDLGMLREDD